MGDRRERRLLTNQRLAALVVVAVVSALLTLFVLDNFVLIEIRLVSINVQMRLAWALVLTAIGGGAIGYALAAWRQRRRR